MINVTFIIGKKEIAFTVALLSVVIALLIFSYRSNEPQKPANYLNLPLITECISQSGLIEGDARKNMVLVRDVQSLCYDRVYGQGLLNDFQLRRLALVEQAYSQGVILWMVVVITLSGVVLAGLQVWASYKLAAAGRGTIEDTALNLERDKLSLKSSIAGLFILIISFAFFYVFVFEIYKIHPIDVDASSKQSTPLVGQIVTPAPAPTPAAKSEN